jgi:hypothetical protein
MASPAPLAGCGVVGWAASATSSARPLHWGDRTPDRLSGERRLHFGAECELANLRMDAVGSNDKVVRVMRFIGEFDLNSAEEGFSESSCHPRMPTPVGNTVMTLRTAFPN